MKTKIFFTAVFSVLLLAANAAYSNCNKLKVLIDNDSDYTFKKQGSADVD